MSGHLIKYCSKFKTCLKIVYVLPAVFQVLRLLIKLSSFNILKNYVIRWELLLNKLSKCLTNYIYYYFQMNMLLSMYVCMYIHIYIRTYVHTYIHTYLHSYIHTHVHTHTYIHMDVSVAEWLVLLTSNCGRIGSIGSSPSNGLKQTCEAKKDLIPCASAFVSMYV